MLSSVHHIPLASGLGKVEELMGVTGEGVIHQIKRLEDRAWKLMKCHVRNKRVVCVNVVVCVPEKGRA